MNRTILILFLVGFSLLGQSIIWCQSDSVRQTYEPGIISTQAVEYGIAFSTDGSELFFARSEQSWGSPDMRSTIFYSNKISGKWSEPQIASFSGNHNDSDPFLTSDGNHLYFISERGDADHIDSSDIWVLHKKTDNSWGQPERLPSTINSTAREYSPRLDSAGNLYFASDRPGGYGQGDLYICRNVDGQYLPPENLGSTVNTIHGEWNLEISDNGDLLIFEASGREENLSSYGDLYISFKVGSSWSIPQNIKEINSTGSDLSPFISSEHNILFFSSSNYLKSTQTDIYFVEFQGIVESYYASAAYPSE